MIGTKSSAVRLAPPTRTPSTFGVAKISGAFDALTGALLWETTLPAAGNATPSIYMIDGRQYVVIMAGGGLQLSRSTPPFGPNLIAFALPGASAPR